jgi:hypothetical protein
VQVNSVFDVACQWMHFGVPVVPLQPRSKHLVAGYGAHSKTITDETEAARWFKDRSCNLGLVTGVPLAVLDFDALEAYSAWCAEWPDLANTLTAVTSRGRHAYFLTDRLLPSTRLAEGLELKAAGSVIVTVPSVHPSGRTYIWQNDSAPLLELPADAPFLAGVAQHDAPVVAASPQIEGCDTVALVKRAWPILEIAMQLTRLKATQGQDRWWHALCPFHKEDRPSFWLDTARGLYGCRSCGEHGDTIDLFARWRGVDTQTAISLMAQARDVHSR